MLHFIQKPFICFAEQKKWLVSIRNTKLVWNWLLTWLDESCSEDCQKFSPMVPVLKNLEDGLQAKKIKPTTMQAFFCLWGPQKIRYLFWFLILFSELIVLQIADLLVHESNKVTGSPYCVWCLSKYCWKGSPMHSSFINKSQTPFLIKFST